MPGFASLPIVVGSNIISKWIKLKDICRLDSAYCNHSTRSAFMKYCESGTLNIKFIDLTSLQMIRWFIIRKLKFRKLSISELVWQEGIDNSMSELLSSIGSHVKEVHFNNLESPLSPMQVVRMNTIIGQKCMNIQKAQIIGHHTDVEVAPLLCGWKSIQELDISGCKITNAFCYIIISIGYKLKCLTLLCTYNICDAGLTALAGKCPELEELSIINCERITANGVLILISTTPKFARLRIKMPDLTDTDTSQFRNLHELTIYDTPALTDSMVATIVQNNPLLNSLTLSNCLQLTATVVLTIVQGCPQLHKLSVSNVPTSYSTGSIAAKGHVEFCSVVTTLIRNQYSKITALDINIK